VPPTSLPNAADDGVAKIKDLTHGLGAHSVIEAVGTQESMMQAIRSTRPGGHVGVSHNVALPGEELFYSHVHLHSGPAPVRRFLPDLIDRIWKREIDPGKVFDLTLPLDQIAEGYKAIDPTVSRYAQPALKLTANAADVCTVSGADIEPPEL
jgi:threonine dehydrogenase-like Zn-dependent dehydrogenase